MDENKRLIRRFVEQLWNDRKLELADEIFAEDCHTHQLQSGSPLSPVPRGPEAIKKHAIGWLASFPDLRFTIEQMIAEQDRVFTQMVMVGTHKGAWLGIPATGKSVSIRMMTVHRIQGGKVVEDWVLVESLGLFQQLGVLPSTTDFVADFVRAATPRK
jgi:steroid delta-isomerase-like uncharacterized protein